MFALPDRLTRDNALVCMDQGAIALSQTNSSEFLIDGQALKQFDSAALAVLVELRRKAAAAGKKLVLLHVQPRLLELATLYGVSKMLGLASFDVNLEQQAQK